MIKVKATQKQVETGPSRTNFETGVEKFSSLPAAFGVFLVGLAVYLKGVVSGRSAPQPPEEGPQVVPAAEASGGGEATYMRAIVERTEDGTLVDEKVEKDGDVLHLTSHSGFRARLAESFVPDQSPPIEIPKVGDIAAPPISRASLQGDTIAFNDNARLGAAAGAIGGGGGGGGAIGAGGGGGGGGDDEVPLLRPSTGEGSGGEGRRNRAPTVTGPVLLRDVSVRQSMFIPLAALLGGAVDPDGDLLRLLNISASAGELKAVDGGFEYTANVSSLGPVTLSFKLSDGEFEVTQVARFAVVEAEPIVGTPGDDMLVGTPYPDLIDGREGDDSIAGLASGDVIVGGDGNDVIDAGEGDDTVFGGAGDDSVMAGSGNDIVWGGEGDDTLLGQGGADILMGEAGNDSLSGGEGNDQVLGGVGNDTVLGDAGRDVVDGGEGDDVVRGGAGNDLLVGGEGADSVAGEAGDDIILADMDAASDSYDGGEGEDRVDFGAAEATLTIDLVAGTVSGEETGEDSIANVEIVIAGSGDDLIRFGTDAVAVAGGEGDDCFDFSALVRSFDAPATVVARATGSEDAGTPDIGQETLAADPIDGLAEVQSTAAASGPGSADAAPADEETAASAPTIEDVLASITSAPPPAPSAPLTVQEILDFAVGDRIKVGDYTIRMRADDDDGYARIRAEDGSELRLEVMQIESGLDNGNSPFRIRIEERDGDTRTVVEVYIDSLDDPDFAIALQGVQALNYYQGG